MVGTRQLAGLIEHAEAQQVKVVLVGDPHQLPEIDAGGLFRALVTRLPAVELTHNRRQAERWEADALDHLRHGDAAKPSAPTATTGGSSPATPPKRSASSSCPTGGTPTTSSAPRPR